jgi:hypothetical protein
VRQCASDDHVEIEPREFTWGAIVLFGQLVGSAEPFLFAAVAIQAPKIATMVQPSP